MSGAKDTFTLVFCKTCLGRVYPITREVDYTGKSQHPRGGENRYDGYGLPVPTGFESAVGFVAEDSYWQVGTVPAQDDCCEIVVRNADQVTPVAVVFFRVACVGP